MSLLEILVNGLAFFNVLSAKNLTNNLHYC